ncbi:unnamed protein product [Nezara viridula]|uniref:Neuropeptide n=2 Tax=Nezara viridula TaxID=85310 RepID=A0A9P0GYN1_NEZVI|nr:unnamed protein product [Nezara viridula]
MLGTSKTATTDENNCKVHQMVLDNRRIKVRRWEKVGGAMGGAYLWVELGYIYRPRGSNPLQFIMSNVFYLVASLFLLLSCSRAAPGLKTVSQACTREKRDAGLFPFPRVGRTFPLTWSFLPLVEPESGERQIKREQLIPFPRVGKSGPKRNGASGNGGLWFGPRLGRLSKRMELVPISYRQENNVPENLLKNSPVKGIGNSNDIDDYIDSKQ